MQIPWYDNDNDNFHGLCIFVCKAFSVCDDMTMAASQTVDGIFTGIKM